MVQLMGDFPPEFTDALSGDGDDVLVVRYPEKVNGDTLPPGIRAVVAVSHGTDNVDEEFLKREGIDFHRVPVAGRDVAEFCVAAAVVLLRRLPVSSVADWARPEGRRLRGRTWGIVGLGVVGKELAKLLDRMGCRIKAFDPYVNADVCIDSLAELSDADVVSVHVPLTGETRHLVDGDFLSSFEGVLIDVSRGGVVDTENVLEALKANTLAGAALDVFPEEPYPGVLLEEGLNLLATPHIAANTRERWRDAAAEVNHLTSEGKATRAGHKNP